jgi:DNA topoisomerase-3
MTGEWEHKLKRMERGELPRSSFMEEIAGLTRRIVEKAKNFEESNFEPKPLGFNAPNGQPVTETLSYYETPDKSVHLRKVVAGRLLEPFEAKELLEKRLIGPLQGFRSKQGWPFAAALKLNDKSEIEFIFDNAPVNADGTKLDVNKQEPVGKCPACGGRVFETLMSYACENTFGDAPTCKMKISKKILMQDIDRMQLEKLLTQKKSDLLRGFVSMKTRRKFSAYLVMDKTGKTTFEFEPRAEGAKGRKPFFKKDPTAEANKNGAVLPKNVIRAKAGARKRAAQKGE